jgi:hypothetical protein
MKRGYVVLKLFPNAAYPSWCRCAIWKKARRPSGTRTERGPSGSDPLNPTSKAGIPSLVCLQLPHPGLGQAKR